MCCLALADTSILRPFAILGICVATLIVLISVLRAHAFLALILAAVLAGMLAPIGSLPGEPQASHWVQAVEDTTTEFGVVAGKIGVVIALASIIGMCVMESGAADKIVRRFLAVFGEERAGLAIVVAGFLLGLPIFFDTFFMLLIPIARALALRTGKNYTLYMLAICCAGAVTHSQVAPHPGPIAMAEILKVDLGWSIIVGALVSILPVALGWQFAKWLNRRTNVPLRETPGTPLADLERIMNKPESSLPSFAASILPVLLPIFLISAASFLGAFGGSMRATPFFKTIEFIGNRNIALLIGAVLSMVVLVRQRRLTLAALGGLIGPALELAGAMILITSAGGAFGGMLRNAGVGDAIRTAASGHNINLVLLAWTVAVVLKFAQGSATVSVLTTAAMMVGMIQGADLPYHPMYIFVAIGFGALGISWMNDSGFWVIGRLSGMNERETLRTWTAVAFFMCTMGLIETLILSTVLPFKLPR
ncbi:MAG TPA: SLC13 family permease [Verrucomicrobiae bacterium]|jgi:GntP family gluconate:H+ symporter|nr:SLC13 family permease [Verrucomicrobiae bacterium]